jgi:hypothetical protein
VVRILVTTTKIDEYEVMYSSNKFPPRIWLKSTGKYIGQLVFMANGATLPLDAKAGTQVSLYYHLDDFQKLHRHAEKREANVSAVGRTWSREREWNQNIG